MSPGAPVSCSARFRRTSVSQGRVHAQGAQMAAVARGAHRHAGHGRERPPPPTGRRHASRTSRTASSPYPGMSLIEEKPYTGYRFFVLNYTQPVDHRQPSKGTFQQRITVLHKDVSPPDGLLHRRLQRLHQPEPQRADADRRRQPGLPGVPLLHALPARPGRLVEAGHLAGRQRPAPRLQGAEEDLLQELALHRRLEGRHDRHLLRALLPAGHGRRRRLRRAQRRGEQGGLGLRPVLRPRRHQGVPRPAERRAARGAGAPRAAGEEVRGVRRRERLDLHHRRHASTRRTRPSSSTTSGASGSTACSPTATRSRPTPRTPPTRRSGTPSTRSPASPPTPTRAWRRTRRTTTRRAPSSARPTSSSPARASCSRYGYQPPRNFVPRDIPMKFQPSAMRDVDSWVRHNAHHMLFVYGQNDPWGAEPFRLGTGARTATSSPRRAATTAPTSPASSPTRRRWPPPPSCAGPGSPPRPSQADRRRRSRSRSSTRKLDVRDAPAGAGHCGRKAPAPVGWARRMFTPAGAAHRPAPRPAARTDPSWRGRARVGHRRATSYSGLRRPSRRRRSR